MEFSIRVLVVLIIALVAFVVFFGMITGWNFKINEAFTKLIEYFNTLTLKPPQLPS